MVLYNFNVVFDKSHLIGGVKMCVCVASDVATENNVLSQMTVMSLSICPVLPLNLETQPTSCPR